MQVQISIVRKDRTEEYTCGSYRVKDENYLYLYFNNNSVSPTSLKQIVPIHDKDIISVNFSYGDM